MKKVIIQNALIIPEIAKIVSEGGGSVTLKTKGNSMLPFIIGERDSVVLAKAEDIKLYDIVLATVNDNQYILHRVVDINGDKLTLMGDGNLKGCEVCSVENVIATAIEIIGGGKRYSCQSEQHFRKAMIWRALLPIRRYLLAAYKLVLKYRYENN